MSNNLKNYPILWSAIPPDFCDERGTPLLEGSTKKFTNYIDSINFSSCPYKDGRSASAKPMNIGALKTILKGDTQWKAATVAYKKSTEVADFSTLENFFRLAKSCVFMPYTLDVEYKGQLPVHVAQVFKFFRGIAVYAEHKLAFGELTIQHHFTMASYSAHHGLLIGEVETCPAPEKLIISIESEIINFLITPNNEINNHDSYFSSSTMQRALIVSGLYTIFNLIIASYIATNCSISQSEYLLKKPNFPIPYYKHALHAVKMGTEKKLLLHINKLFTAYRGCHSLHNQALMYLEQCLAELDREKKFKTKTDCYELVSLINIELINQLNIKKKQNDSLNLHTVLDTILRI
ncbi:hypothetical protein [Iodobacter sp.]|uniref:hypothetical protein n=1 Tax=Iodobacter sp. TaxID=1915058 RepID=UPI0025EBF614|nr:hypothetical protein [Iodobacter sp.]